MYSLSWPTFYWDRRRLVITRETPKISNISQSQRQKRLKTGTYRVRLLLDAVSLNMTDPGLLAGRGG